MGQRRENQQDRIAQGPQRQWKPGETAKPENREQRINHRFMPIGRRTAENRPAQAPINAQQKRASRAIYRNKHN